MHKEKKQRTERITKMRKELFVAEQQLEKSQEEDEIQPRKLVSQQSACTDPMIDICTKLSSSNEPTLPELHVMSGLNADVDRQMNALGLMSAESSDESEVHILGTKGSNISKDSKLIKSH